MFSARAGHQAVAYGGSLWVIGGVDGGQLNDVWRSVDGARWDLTAVDGDRFSKRSGHQVVVHQGPRAFIYERVDIVAPVAGGVEGVADGGGGADDGVDAGGDGGGSGRCGLSWRGMWRGVASVGVDSGGGGGDEPFGGGGAGDGVGGDE